MRETLFFWWGLRLPLGVTEWAGGKMPTFIFGHHRIMGHFQMLTIRNENKYAVLMEATKYCSLGQLTAAMFEVGGQYRRNM